MTHRVADLARTLALTALACFATAALLLGSAATASAHDVLTGSDPADGARVDRAPDHVTLTFNNSPTGYATVTVVGPGGTHWEHGPTAQTDNRISVGMGPLGPAGTYEIGYRLVSSDGHPITGETRFDLTRPGGGTPDPPTAAAAGSSSDSGAGGSGGLPVWPFVLAAVVIVVGALALALRRRPGA